MESIRELYRIGYGPSSSHTMGPRKAAEIFKQRTPQAAAYRVTLFASLAATGRGHMTDVAVNNALAPVPVEILWEPEKALPLHPNGMQFKALDAAGQLLAEWQVYSIGGGALRTSGPTGVSDPTGRQPRAVYDRTTMDSILAYCQQTGKAFWEYVLDCEGPEIWQFLAEVWHTMQAAIDRGIETEGVLPGDLGLARKAWAYHRKALTAGEHYRRPGFLAAYSLAVAEENAAGGRIVTAPTCGSCGVLPGVLRYLQETLDLSENTILRALATAGLIGNLVKHNASISGAEVGCQGEIGAACAMAAAASTQLLGGTVGQIEYAAEMGLEHHLGLTCDPVGGLVQVPCIERNAFAATRAQSSADYALFSDGHHFISFDEVVAVMRQTGHDLPSLYRETASGGLAAAYTQRPRLEESEA